MCTSQRPLNGADSAPVLSDDHFRERLLDYLAFLRATAPLYSSSAQTRTATVDAVEAWVRAMSQERAS